MQTNKINIYQAKLSLRQCWSAVSLIGDMWGHPTCITEAGGSFYTHLLEVKLLHLHVVADHRQCFCKCFFAPYPSLPSGKYYGQYVTAFGWMPLPGLPWLCIALGCSSCPPPPQHKHLPPSSSLIFVDILKLLLLHASH